MKNVNEKKTNKLLSAMWSMGILTLVVIVLVLLAISSGLNKGDGDNSYRIYATLAGWLASIGIIVTLVGLFIAKPNRNKITLGICLPIFLLLALYGFFVSSFSLVW